MSFILDALRRAESERARGQVPGLHDQPLLPAAAVPHGVWPVWAWAVMASLVLVLATGAGWWLWRPPAGAMPADVQQAVPATAAVAAAPATVSAPPPVLAPPATPAQVTTPLMPQVVSAPSPVEPAPVAASVAAPPAAPAVAPVVKLAELPADLRREWPNLVMGGSVWSESAASRFVIINGLLLHEGEAVAPGLVVDRIGPKGLVLRWRDRRVEVPL